MDLLTKWIRTANSTTRYYHRELGYGIGYSGKYWCGSWNAKVLQRSDNPKKSQRCPRCVVELAAARMTG